MFDIATTSQRLTARPVTILSSVPAGLPTDPAPLTSIYEPLPIGLYVAKHGALRIITNDGYDVTFENVPDSTFMRISPRYVVQPTVSGSHASGIVALIPINEIT